MAWFAWFAWGEGKLSNKDMAQQVCQLISFIYFIWVLTQKIGVFTTQIIPF